MSVRIYIPTPLRRYSEQNHALDVEAGTLREALEALFDRFPGLRTRLLDESLHLHPYLILLHGEEELPRDAWQDRVLGDGDEIDIVPAVEGGSDVRMRGFRDRATVAEALAWASADLRGQPCLVSLDEAAGRVLWSDVKSSCDVPLFDRSAMDGYAVVAEDTFSASTLNPMTLTLCGESMPGGLNPPAVKSGEACRIMTGAPLPGGATAVVMAEDCREDEGQVLVMAAVTPGKNVGRRGEDIREGQVVLSAGRRLRPQDVGLLSSIGKSEVEVFARPRVRTLVTGNEVLPPGSTPAAGHVVDSNSPMLRALIERDGGEVLGQHRLPDSREDVRRFLSELDCDVLVCAGGSSVGREDYLPLLVAELGELPVHGIAMRPSAPTGLGRIGTVRVFLLPGNPVSCLSAYDHFCGVTLRLMGGRPATWPYRVRTMSLTRRISSLIGRTDYVRVMEVAEGLVEPIALAGAGILSSTTRASGFVLVPEDVEGFGEGDEVLVHLYDQEVERPG